MFKSPQRHHFSLASTIAFFTTRPLWLCRCPVVKFLIKYAVRFAMPHMTKVVKTFPSARIAGRAGVDVEVSLITQLGHGAGNQIFTDISRRQSTNWMNPQQKSVIPILTRAIQPRCIPLSSAQKDIPFIVTRATVFLLPFRAAAARSCVFPLQPRRK